MKPVDPGPTESGQVNYSGLQTYAVIKKRAGIARLGHLYFVKENCERETRSASQLRNQTVFDNVKTNLSSLHKIKSHLTTI